MISKDFFNRFDLTLIIVHDPSLIVRGYSILGREFRLRHHEAIIDECKTIDGVVFKDEGYLIDRHDYLKVVPEAMPSEYKERYVFIPKWAAKISFRPKSLS